MGEFESSRAFEHIDKLAYEIGPRLAGTRGDRMAAEYIRKQFESYGLKPRVQEFKFVNRASQRQVAACLLAAAFIASLFLPSPFVLLTWFVAIVVWRSLNRLLPKRSSRNIIAISKIREPKKRVTVTAHYDSAPCMVSYRLHLFLKFAFLPIIAAISIVLIFRALGWVQSWPVVWTVLGLAFLPVCASMFINASSRRVSPGADDNASGVAVMLEAARVIAEDPPPDIELSFTAFGAEEQGLIGARKLVKEKSLPPETLVLNLDGVGVGPRAYVVKGNGILRRTRTSPKLNQALTNSIKAAGLTPRVWWAALAGHDHIPLVRARIQATTFTTDVGGRDKLGCFISRAFRLPNARVRGYRYIHTSDDIPDRIGLENIERAGSVVLDFVKSVS